MSEAASQDAVEEIMGLVGAYTLAVARSATSDDADSAVRAIRETQEPVKQRIRQLVTALEFVIEHSAEDFVRQQAHAALLRSEGKELEG
jgi:hypothetical protein